MSQKNLGARGHSGCLSASPLHADMSSNEWYSVMSAHQWNLGITENFMETNIFSMSRDLTKNNCIHIARICVGRPCRPRERGPKQHASLPTSRAAALPPQARLDLQTRYREMLRFQ